MPSDNREHIDEKLANRDRGDKRVPTPIVEGTGKKDGSDLSHRGQDEKDLTVGTFSDFQTKPVSPELEEYANAKGRQQTLDRDIAELEKATGAVKDELEAQIAGKYKPQNIHHGQKKETRQSDLLEEEAEKLKSLTEELKGKFDEPSKIDSDDIMEDDTFEDKQRKLHDLANYHDHMFNQMKEMGILPDTPETDADPKALQDPKGDDLKMNEKLKSLTMELKDEKQEKFPTEEEIREEKHEAAKKRKKEIWDKARREGIGMSWDHKLDKASDTMDKVRKRIKRLRDLAVEDYKRSHPLEKTSTPVDRHSAKERNDPQQLREMQEERRAKRSNVGAKGREARRQKLVGKLPDLDDVEKSAKGKVTSWNRMDSGVRNEHRNTLGLSSIGDYDSLSPADRKKVKDAGFWRENIKEQPIKEGTHFGDTGSTPELEQEKKTPAPKAKPSTGKGYVRTRAGSRRLKMASISTLLKIQSADLDTERVSHKNPTKPTIGGTDNPTRSLPSSTGRDLDQGYTGNQTTPDKPKQTGTLPKVESREATQATGQGKTENISSTSGNTGTIGQQSQARKPDEEKGWNKLTKKPIENKPKRGEGVRSKLGKLRDQAVGFLGGNNKKDSPWGKGGAKQDKKIGGHKEDTTSQSHQYHSGKKQSVHEPNIPKGGKAPHTRTDYDDPLIAPRHDEQEGDGKQNQSWSQAGNNSGQKGNKKQTQGRTRAGQRGNKKQTQGRTRAGERSNSAEENKKKLARTRAGSRNQTSRSKRYTDRKRAGDRFGKN